MSNLLAEVGLVVIVAKGATDAQFLTRKNHRHTIEARGDSHTQQRLPGIGVVFLIVRCRIRQH